MTDEIKITYLEFDDQGIGVHRTLITRLIYVEYMQHGVRHHAYAEPAYDAYRGTDDAGEHGIPDDVREHLALLIAPHLRSVPR